MILDQIKAIATDVRQWAESRAEGGYGEGDLCGWCAIASGELFRKLQKAGIESEIFLHESKSLGHAFVVTQDYVVDVTATQFHEFRDKTVIIMHLREAEAYLYYSSITRVFKDVDSFRRFQKKNGWPTYQIAYNR